MLYAGSDNLIRLTGLKDALTAVAVTDAVVTARVVGVGDAVTLTGDGQGNYSGTIDVEIVAGTAYTLEVVATKGSFQLTIRREYTARYARGT